MVPSFVPKVDYDIINARCSHACSASVHKANSRMQTLLAAAAEKRMLYQAIIDAAMIRQQALFEQYKNNELILSLISLENNSQEKYQQGGKHDSHHSALSTNEVDEDDVSDLDDDTSRASSRKDDSSISFGPDEMDSARTNNSSLAGDEETSSLTLKSMDDTEELITGYSHCSNEVFSVSERDDSSFSEGSSSNIRSNISNYPELSDSSSDVSIASSQKPDNLTITITPEQEKKWKCRFNEFLEYVRENGHGAVPQVYPKNQQLSRWVRRQRQQYKFYKDGKKSAMTAERLDSLTSAGFIWHGHEVIWVERINALKRYRKRYGDCNVTISFDKKLGAWVKHQRRHYKLYKEGRPSSINAQRVEELNKMGFDWQPSKKVL